MSRDKYWWPNNFIQKGDNFKKFWEEYLYPCDKSVLFILGKGFDPRMNLGLSTVIECFKDSSLECLLINYDEGENSPSREYEEKVQENYNALTTLVDGKTTLREVEIRMLNEERRIEGREAAQIFSNEDSLNGYTDIIIDISALPRSIYFNLVAQLLELCKTSKKPTGGNRNIHIIVAENSKIDVQIEEQELDEKADYMPLLSGSMTLSATMDQPVIWFPVLGEGKEEHINRIYNLLSTSMVDEKYVDIEVCPVLPFPAKNLRRPDIIIAEYHRVFDALEVESRNIIYSDEQNPFDVYQQIIDAAQRYDEALSLGKPGGCRLVVSALSSKLLSLGVLLAAFEGQMAVAYVGAQGYRYTEKQYDANDTELFEVWIEGEPYEK